MEQRKLGPVVGLGTYGTFDADAALATDVVGGGARRRGRRCSTPRRCTAAPSGRSARRSPAGATQAVSRRRSGRPMWRRAGASTRRSERSSAASRSSRCTTSSPGAITSRGSRSSARQARIGRLGVTDYRAAALGELERGAPDGPVRHRPDPAQPARARLRAPAAPSLRGARHRGDRDASARRCRGHRAARACPWLPRISLRSGPSGSRPGRRRSSSGRSPTAGRPRDPRHRPAGACRGERRCRLAALVRAGRARARRTARGRIEGCGSRAPEGSAARRPSLSVRSVMATRMGDCHGRARRAESPGCAACS